jgi:hypothetical protein
MNVSMAPGPLLLWLPAPGQAGEKVESFWDFASAGSPLGGPGPASQLPSSLKGLEPAGLD